MNGTLRRSSDVGLAAQPVFLKIGKQSSPIILKIRKKAALR